MKFIVKYKDHKTKSLTRQWNWILLKWKRVAGLQLICWKLKLKIDY